LPAVGENAQLHVTQTQQTLDGPQTSAFDVLVRRRTATTVVLERTLAGGAIDDSVFSLNRDGALVLAPSEAAVTHDGDLQTLVQGVNLGLGVMRGAVAPPAGWEASLSVPLGARSAATTVVVPLRPLNVAGNDFDLAGSAQNEPQDTGGGSGSAPRRVRPSGGGFPGGGFPGGGGPGGGSPGGGFPTATRSRDAGGSPITVLVHVTGHVSDGRLRRLTIAQTRVVDVEGMTFTNVSSWDIAVVK
jgi:hypothetical protein